MIRFLRGEFGMIQHIFNKQQQFFYSQETKSEAFRRKQLKTLKKAIKKYETAIEQALYEDLHKSRFEAYTTEIGLLYTEINFMLDNLSKWIEKQPVPSPFTHVGAKSYLMREPYGVTLIIAPWNYPFQLSIAPLIGAIAAGNCAVLKPSEYSPNTSTIIRNMMKEFFDEQFIAVVEGGVPETTALLNLPFDYIFFTGSTQVGKIIMEKASQHLTPITLELGGKSPTIVDSSANLKLAAKRIVWGKFTNAGQTCVAPDFIYVHNKVYKKFLTYLKQEIEHFFGKHPLQHSSYGKIINRKHFDRLLPFLQDGTTYVGGQYNQSTLKIEPTILTDITWDHSIMKDEIFGPILPVLTYNRLETIISILQKKPKPLALYLFTEKQKIEDLVLSNLAFGGGCINDTLYHLANSHLPFGGVGPSGIGRYHGKYSFDTFTHEKSILKQTTSFDLPVRYPSNLTLPIIKKLMK